MIATASPRSRDAVEALGADRIVDYTATAVTEAISEPVEVVLNLVNAPESDLAGLTDSSPTAACSSARPRLSGTTPGATSGA